MPINEDNRLYEFGGYRLDPSRRLLRDRDGTQIALKPKALDTLVYLVEHAGELLEKTRLMRAVWADVIVEENSLNQHISILRHVFGEKPGENRYIVTVPGRGYRFVATVRTESRGESERFDAHTAGGEEAEERRRRTPMWRGWYIAAGVVGAALLLVIAGSIRSPITSPTAQTIAVLPFDNLSPDGDLEYFSDGISIELMELLTKIPNLRVIARDSAFWFKGSDATDAEIGAMLGVGRLLEGTVRVMDDQVRVTASLIDTGTGTQVWSDSFGPRPMTDLFAIQTEIAREVVDKLQIALAAEFPTIDETKPEVHSLYLQARYILTTVQFGRMGYARDLLEKAVEDDPDFFPARHWLAAAYYYLSKFSPGPDRAENRRLWGSTIEHVALRWPDRPEIDLHRALYAYENEDYATAAQYLERSLRQDPGASQHWAVVQNLLHVLNRPEDAVKVGEHVLLSDPICGECYNALGRNYVALRRFEDAMAIRARAENLGLELRLLEPWYGQALLFSDAEAALAVFRRDEIPPAVELGGSAMALHALGRLDEYEQALAELTELVRTQPDLRPLLARVHAFVGDIDRAFEILNGLPELPASVLSDPEFESLREHPHYEELLEKAGIRPDWRESIPFEFHLPD